MFRRFCLLCLILHCRVVVGRLPGDVLPINTFEDVEGRLAQKFSGVHSIVYVNRDFYVLSKNQVASLKVVQDNVNPSKLLVREVINWPSSEPSGVLCQQKTGDKDSCHNFIRIFTPKDGSDREFLVCGTQSFDPKCRIYTLQGDMFKEDSRSHEFSGKAICPYDPKQTGAFIYTGGDLYSATVEDFLGTKPVVYRYAVATKHSNLKGTKASLSDPWFVKFVESGPKVYIFFKETSIEDGTGLTYSRVGQICKSDEGGVNFLRKQFTSYNKARLNCSYPGNPPFYFDELGAASEFFDMPGQSGQKVLFAAMNTPRNSIWGSAVCAFLEKDIEATLRKPYLEQHISAEGATYWTSKESDPAVTEALSRCQFDDDGKPVLSVENLQFVRDHPLKAFSVPSWAKNEGNSVPVFMKLNAQYQLTAIAIDPVAGATMQHFVMILGTSNGKVLKVIPALTDEMDKAHFVGETLAYDETICGDDDVPDRQVRDIKIDNENGFFLVAFSSCVVTIPFCPLSGSTCQRACISARDPYCAWDGAKCLSVPRPQGGLQQDVLHGDVSRTPPCEAKPDDGLGSHGGADEDGGGGTLDATGSSVDDSNATETIIPIAEHTTPGTALPARASMSSNIIYAVGGFLSALVLVGVIFCFHKWRRKACHFDKEYKEGSDEIPIKDPSHAEDKRNSHGSKQERPLSNHTQRQHSKRSNSSVDEEDAFVDNASEGNANSIEKQTRRKKSANRKSTSSSYRREDSLEKPPSINRQTSRDSNPESGSNKDGSTNEAEFMFSPTEATQPMPSQNPNLQRTYSTSGRSEGIAQRPNGHKLNRQYSLQLSMNPNAVQYTHTLTPMPFTNKNPLDSHMQQRPNFVQAPPPHGAFDPTSGTWHTTPGKNPGLTRDQTKSLDRKMLKSRPQGHPPHLIPHDVQQQPRGYADTLPPPGMEDPKAHARRRYPSESVVIGNRPHLMHFASKPPGHQSIEEETSPTPEQNSPTKFPTIVAPRNVGRMPRPNQLPLGMDQPMYRTPYSNPGTPMNEQMPLIVSSPMQSTLPTHLRRQFSDVSRSIAPSQPHDFPHPQSAPIMPSYPPQAEKLSKGNPDTSEWDGNHNNFFPEPVPPAGDLRTRNPSGKSNTPSTPLKEFPGFGHPDVIPTSTTARPSAETTYLSANDALESSA